MKKNPKAKGRAPKPPTPPPQPPVGQVAMTLAADIQALARAAGTYRIAYDRLTQAIDQLKVREPYLALEQELVALLQVKPGEVG